MTHDSRIQSTWWPPQTKLTVVANIVWDKFTFLKSTIETETMNGLENYYEVLEKELQTSFNQSGESKINFKFWTQFI